MERMFGLSVILMGFFIVKAWPAVSTELLNGLPHTSMDQKKMFQTPLSLDAAMTTSSEMAAQSCRDSFRWQRWNCPRTDFFMRYASQRPLLPDREDVYVNAITTAALLYTIAKNCSSGIVSGCDCESSSTAATQPATTLCSDDPVRSEKLYERHVSKRLTDSFSDSIKQHNHKVITNLLRNSLVDQCTGSKDARTQEATMCRRVLRPFAEIAHSIKLMYDKSLQLSTEGSNARIMWKNIPLDAFVFVKDSPNYCEPEARPGWNGMRGRRCMGGSSGSDSAEERQSCRHLCRACGYRVHTQNVLTQRTCNCRYTLGGLQAQCDVCVTLEKQHSCY